MNTQELRDIAARLIAIAESLERSKPQPNLPAKNAKVSAQPTGSAVVCYADLRQFLASIKVPIAYLYEVNYRECREGADVMTISESYIQANKAKTLPVQIYDYAVGHKKQFEEYKKLKPVKWTADNVRHLVNLMKEHENDVWEVAFAFTRATGRRITAGSVRGMFWNQIPKWGSKRLRVLTVEQRVYIRNQCRNSKGHNKSNLNTGWTP